MSINIKSKWIIWCNDENKYVEGWSTSIPSTCYNNNTHSVNTLKVKKIIRNDDTIIKIKEEAVETGGYYKATTIKCDIPAGVTGDISIFDHLYPHPINMLNVFFNTDNTHKGDVVSASVAPDTIVGVLTDDIINGVTSSINVSQTVIDNIAVGYYISIDNGVTSAEIGCVTAINDINNNINLSSTINETFSSGSYVKMTVKMMDDFHLESSHRYVLGSNKIGASYIPANTTGRILYQNNDGQAKTFIFGIEYLY